MKQEYKVRKGITAQEEQDRVYQKGTRCTVMAMLGKFPKVTENRFNPEKVQVCLWVEKGSRSAEAMMKAAKAGIAKAKEKGIELPNTRIVKNGEKPGVTVVNDGDLYTERGTEFEDLAKGCWVFSAHSNDLEKFNNEKNEYTGEWNATTWVENASGELELVKARRGDFLGGNIVVADVNFAPYNVGGGCGVTCYLNSIERYADGEPFTDETSGRQKTPPKTAPTRYSAKVLDSLEEQEDEEMERRSLEQESAGDITDDDWDDFLADESIDSQGDDFFELTDEDILDDDDVPF